jgi:hypothetical protein
VPVPEHFARQFEDAHEIPTPIGDDAGGNIFDRRAGHAFRDVGQLNRAADACTRAGAIAAYQACTAAKELGPARRRAMWIRLQ